MREPEPETIGRAQAGDLRAFESLVRDHQAVVWRFAYHLTRNRATADDVTQETFLRAFRGLPSYRGDTKFTSWLVRIAHNAAVDAYRKTRREGPLPDDHDPAILRAAPTAGSPTVDRVAIEAALRSLAPDLREPFVLIEVLGFTYAEAGAILRVKVGTVKSRMHRARAALVVALGDREATGEV